MSDTPDNLPKSRRTLLLPEMSGGELMESRLAVKRAALKRALGGEWKVTAFMENGVCWQLEGVLASPLAAQEAAAKLRESSGAHETATIDGSKVDMTISSAEMNTLLYKLGVTTPSLGQRTR